MATKVNFQTSKEVMDESRIVEGLRKGSREALAALWDEKSESVLNLSFRILKDRDAAEDLLMEIFTSIPFAISSFRGKAKISTWLYRMTVNACLSKLRIEKRHRELLEENNSFIVEEFFKEEEPGDILETKLLEKAFGALSAETRSMLWLKDAEGLSVEDLSEIFLHPEGTIKAKLSRARDFIRNYFKGKSQR